MYSKENVKEKVIEENYEKNRFERNATNRIKYFISI